jgi:hypothetical protein
MRTSGGSTTMAFDGKVLNRPSDPGGERPVAETLAVLYSGVYAPAPALAVVSPNGDGIAERQQLSYKVVSTSTVTASLLGPGGATAFKDSGTREPGVYNFAWPSPTRRRTQDDPLGRWRWVVKATDTNGQESSVERAFWLNDTLGFIRVAPRSVKLRKKSRSAVVARFKLAYPARVTPSIWTTRGILIRRLPARNLGAGTRARERRHARLVESKPVERSLIEDLAGRSNVSFVRRKNVPHVFLEHLRRPPEGRSDSCVVE